MPQLTDNQRYFICTIQCEEEKRTWGFIRFQREFPNFMENIGKKQFDRVVANFNQSHTMKHVQGSGRRRLSEEVAEAVVSGLQTPPGEHGDHKSQRQVARELGIAQSSVSKIAKQ